MIESELSRSPEYQEALRLVDEWIPGRIRNVGNKHSNVSAVMRGIEELGLARTKEIVDYWLDNRLGLNIAWLVHNAINALTASTSEPLWLVVDLDAPRASR